MSGEGEQSTGRCLLDGRYRLIERLGAGGAVWRARDEVAGLEVAAKQPLLPADSDPDGEECQRAAHRLYHEARAAARVAHPAAVATHDVFLEDGLLWIVMEWVEGESLLAVLRRGPLAPAEAARIGLAVLGALRAAHAVGIVHRDVKPANVLVESGTGRVVLTDFGIGHGGSPGFLSPEQLSGPGAGPASDLWSLGALLHAAVEGRPPFRRTAAESTPAGPAACEHAGPLAPLLLRLLAPEPDARPAAEEVAAALEEVADRVVPGTPLRAHRLRLTLRKNDREWRVRHNALISAFVASDHWQCVCST
ncbi:serine/threonine-protein kinase [Streptomyces sp. V3I7]|uniref:serine/threonine-protein kinase n=1 Tax=Streptomyces sp. V3I7 TaxID=3042278 RepID=UPI00277D8A79|nr:serine/threonine-protein kinase [Streptomyces sp. V3I7]MDQ0992557.1 serine/threonine protein kinase [Streptomyces sp. V3I7]